MIKKALSLFLRLFVCACVTLSLVSFVDMTYPRAENSVYDGIIRLHILANSDSRYDQALKLEVRDAIIDECRTLCGDGKCDTDALAECMTFVANRVLSQSGVDYGAYAVLGKERYTTREYDGIAFPAGEYMSLRIVLGEGEGHNWWCVLFPPLCLSAATAKDKLEGAGIDDNSYKVYTQRKYMIRFRFLEWFN